MMPNRPGEVAAYLLTALSRDLVHVQDALLALAGRLEEELPGEAAAARVMGAWLARSAATLWLLVPDAERPDAPRPDLAGEPEPRD